MGNCCYNRVNTLHGRQLHEKGVRLTPMVLRWFDALNTE